MRERERERSGGGGHGLFVRKVNWVYFLNVG